MPNTPDYSQEALHERQVYITVNSPFVAMKIANSMSKNLFDGKLEFYSTGMTDGGKFEVRCKSWINPVCENLAQKYAQGYYNSFVDNVETLEP